MQTDLYTTDGKRVFESAHLAVTHETQATLEVLRHLQAIEDRQLYLERGYPSLFECCTKEFRYSSGAAYRRIQAMRLLKSTPAISDKIAEGQVSITSAAAIQSFLQVEAKSGTSYSETAKLELIDVCAGKSSREVEKEFVTRNPDYARRESIRAISDDLMRVSLSITDELWRKIEQLKALRSHADPNMTNEALLRWLVELGLDKVDPVRKAERSEARAQKLAEDSADGEKANTSNDSKSVNTSKPTSAPNESTRHESAPRTRYVRAKVQHALAPSRKDGCAYVDPVTGRRCGSHYFLQKDHVISYSENGPNEIWNFQWLCGAHNRFKYSRVSNVFRGCEDRPSDGDPSNLNSQSIVGLLMDGFVR